MAEKKKNSLWLPISMWNLNEVFTTESISPFSFYAIRDFGNPVNRNQGPEDKNNLILFDDQVKSDILMEIDPELLDEQLKHKKSKPKRIEYSKTIYLRNGLFKVHFCSQAKLQEFLTQTFMLLEVKTVNKYKDSFVVNEENIMKKLTYQAQIFSEKNTEELFFDKAFNQVKGMIYGYVIGLLGTLSEDEQGLVSNMSNLKNTIGGAHTDIVLTEQYSGLWLKNVSKQIDKCTGYFKHFNIDTDVFDTILLRLKEVDNLNKMRCEELEKQKGPNYKREFEQAQNSLEQTKREFYNYESKSDITSMRKELQEIKNQEKENGKRKGKKREYFKKDSPEYQRKQELEDRIAEFEKKPEYAEYAEYKQRIEHLEAIVKNYQQGYTYDTSISEQFNRITEQLNGLIKRTANSFLSKNSGKSELPDISFHFNIEPYAKYYRERSYRYTDFSIQLPQPLLAMITKEETDLLLVSLNAILSFPQGCLGNYSEENIIQMLVEIGKHLPDSAAKNTLREYYIYRKAEADSFVFPEKNDVLANLIVFFMKLQGPDQINKMLVAKNIKHKEIAFMLYGAYTGFANMPKTFTNVIFDWDNAKLFDHIDDYLFKNYLTYLTINK
ncbi:MAG: hypothetical protein LBP85_06220 [Prevotellaceae bacterium]|jgi:hypothetical protein|nr:hypothetical protein [Prevotellaceae bacterium]